MKRVRQALAMVMTVLLVAGLLPWQTAIAAEKQDGIFHYVSIGDSTTNGYGFDGYYAEDGTDVRGFLRVEEQAYPALITKMLEQQYGEGKVVLHQLAGSAMRPDDLDAILDPNHVNDDFTNRVFNGYNEGHDSEGEEWFLTWANQIPGVSIPVPERGNYASQAEYLAATKAAAEQAKLALRQEFYSDIAQADLITYYLGSNNFGTFLTGAITSDRYGDRDNLQDQLGYLGITKEQIDVSVVRQQMMDMLKENLDGTVNVAELDAQFGQYVDLLVQGFVSFVVYFTKNMAAIRMINPDCDVIVMGLHSYVDFLQADYNGMTLDLGTYYGDILELANTYMGALCSSSDSYYYADLYEADIPIFFDELVDGEPSDVIQKDLDEMIGGIAKGTVPGLSGMPDVQIGAMLRGWYENGYTDSDWPLLAQLATAMGQVNDEAQAQLQAYDITLADALKNSWLYYTENDAFVPLFAAMLNEKLPDDPLTRGFLPLLAPNLNSMLTNPGNVTFAFMKEKVLPELRQLAPMAGVDIDSLLTLLHDIGEKVDGFRTYGSISEMLVGCANTKPLDAQQVFGIMSGGIDMNAIGAEIAAAVTNGTELSETTKIMINLYFMFMFPNGEGVSAHPNAAGHQIMAQVIWDAYQSKLPAKSYMVNKKLAEAADMIDMLVEYAQSKGFCKVDSYCTWDPSELEIESYTSLGDSTVFGYGFHDLSFDDERFLNSYGYEVCSPGAYPALLKDYLKISDDQFAQLAMGCLRVEDIRYILDKNYVGDGYTVESIVPMLQHYGGSVDQVRANYEKNIKKADLITVCMGGNNFSTFLGRQMNRVQEGEAPLAMDWSRYQDSTMAQIKGAVQELSAVLQQYAPDLDTSLARVVAESVLYAYVGVTENFAPVMDMIHSMNQDAKLVLVGLYNPVDDVYYQMEGTEKALHLGELLDVALAYVNAQFRGYAEAHSDYCAYADITDVEIFADVDENRASINLADGEYLDYTTANNGVAGHPDESGHAYIFRQIKSMIPAPYMTGDFDGDGTVTSDDAVYLLYHTLLPDTHPINQPADFNGDENVTSDDAVYLLYYTLLPDTHPLH